MTRKRPKFKIREFSRKSRDHERTLATLDDNVRDQIAGYHRIENSGRTTFIVTGTLQSISGFVNAFENASKDPHGLYHGLSHNYGLMSILGIYLPYAYLQIQMRRQVKKEEPELKTDNAWSIIRNPIYTGMRLFSLGLFAAGPSLFNAVNGLGIFVGTEISARAEERKLELYFGDKYRNYASRVNRWLPKLRYNNYKL